VKDRSGKVIKQVCFLVKVTTYDNIAAQKMAVTGIPRTARPFVLGKADASPLPHLHPGNLNEAICVLQLKVPLDFKYSFVYQKVQSSTGSTVMLL